jgi:transcriptional regulator with XRE-family HTH domain
MDHPVRAARMARGVSQTTLAGMIGITPGQLCNIELGKRRLTTGVARRVELALDLPVDSLAQWADDMPMGLIIHELDEDPESYGWPVLHPLWGQA